MFQCGNMFSQDRYIEERQYLFNKEIFKRHINYLGSDLFEGRAPGTLGGNLSAAYLAHEFAKISLKPLGGSGTYYQNIPLHSSRPLLSSKLNIHYLEEVISFRLNEDFLLFQTGEPVFIPNSIPLVFVGYGIVAPEFDYNDYQDFDVSGKIVVFLDGEPISSDSTYFDGENPTIYSIPAAKHRIALSRGAKGSILIPNVKADKVFSWDEQVLHFSFPNLSLASTVSSSFDMMMNPDVADILFTGSKYTLNDIFDLHFKSKIESFILNTQLSFKGSFMQSDFISPNIIGMIEGSDSKLRDSYVLVSAHYDHLGTGTTVNGDSIYNGVSDNAVGVSAVLEIARVFSQNKTSLKRSLIILLTTAEESGLLGSYYYTQNPSVPLYKTIANINIDGIASFDNFSSIIAIGKEFSELSNFIKDIAAERNLRITEIPPEFKSFNAFSKSDQYSFAKAGIPSMMITEGPDYLNIDKEEGLQKLIDYASNIYHSPFDDLSQDINYDAVVQHIEILYSMIEKLANTEKEPEWFSGVPFINARLISKVEKR